MTKKGFPIMIFTAAAMLTAAAIRFFQYVTCFNFETGFFALGSETAVKVLRVLIIAEALALAALCVVGKVREWSVATVSFDGMSEKATLFLGIAYLLAAALQLWQTAGVSGGGLMFAVSAVQTLVFAATGFLMIKNTAPPKITGYIQVLLSISLFIRSVDCFSSDLIIRTHSETIIRLLVYVSGALFCNSAARCYGRVETKASRMKELFCAGMTFIFSGMHLFSKLMMYITGNAGRMSPPDLSAVCLFLLSGTFIAVLSFTDQYKAIDYITFEDDKKKKKGENEAEENEQKEEAGEL